MIHRHPEALPEFVGVDVLAVALVGARMGEDLRRAQSYAQEVGSDTAMSVLERPQ